MIFHKELKKFRETKQWSKKTMSQFLYNTNYDTYVRWENGGKPPLKNVQCFILHIIFEHPIVMSDLEEK